MPSLPDSTVCEFGPTAPPNVVVEPDHVDFTKALPHLMSALDYPMGNASTFS